jgi:hypothetical protein
MSLVEQLVHIIGPAIPLLRGVRDGATQQVGGDLTERVLGRLRTRFGEIPENETVLRETIQNDPTLQADLAQILNIDARKTTINNYGGVSVKGDFVAGDKHEHHQQRE